MPLLFGSSAYFNRTRNLICLPALLSSIVACSSGADDAQNLDLHDDPVSLTSKADLVRELQIVNYFVAYGDGEVQSRSALAKAWRSSSTESKAGGMRLKAESTNCESGSDHVEEGAKSRTFTHFGVSQQVSYTRNTASNCRRTDVSGVDSITYNGTVEDGQSSSGSYTYTIAGAGSAEAEIAVEQDGALFHQSLLGVFETRLVNSAEEERQTAIYKFDHDGGSAIVGEFGKAGEPFTKTDGNGRFTVSGPYRYTSTECTGGSVLVATDSPVVVTRGYPTSGTLRFASGDDSASVTIASDNSATIRFKNGSTASISASEMRRVYDDFDTDCVLDRFDN